MITDPLREDRLEPRRAHGFPAEAPPNFALRKNLSPIVAFVDRVQEALEDVRRSIERRLRRERSTS
jgi:hypothetical protein